MLFFLTVAIIVGSLSAALTYWAAGWLRKRAVMDLPGDRSNHDVPTPRGGGIAIMAAVTLAWVAVIVLWPQESTGMALPILAAGLALATLSWLDDLRNLGPGLRLLAHLAACAVGVWALPGPVFQGLLPDWADMALTLLVWAGFVNFYNFMDGIDGITGVETLAIGLGLFGVAALTPADSLPLAGPLILAAAAGGFLVFNWAPARLFMGDVGSVPLGFLLGWFLFFVAAKGYWLPALILPAYYLADAGLTLLRRAARGEKVWQAHKEHFYQRAVARLQNAGLTRPAAHRRVSGGIGLANLLLILAVLLFPSAPVPVLAGSAGVVLLLLIWMGR